jgi:outer membrane assembly lipoprotein YfiO
MACSNEGTDRMRKPDSACGVALVWAAGIAMGLLGAGAADAQKTWRLEDGKLKAVAPPAPGTPEALIAGARQLYVEGKFRQARKILEKWLKKHPYAANSDMALLYLGDCQYKQKDYWKAYQTYEQLVNNFTGSRAYRLALGRQFKVALMFLNGVKRKWLGMRILPMEDEAVRLLDGIRDREEGTLLGEKCLLVTANFHYARADFFDAEYRYALYLQLYPNGSATREALWRLAWCYQGLYRGTKYDSSALAKARETFQRFRARYPNTPQAAQVPDVLARVRWAEAKKEYEIGRYYLRAGRPKAAAYYFRTVIAEHAQSEWATKSRAELEKLGYAPAAEPPQPSPTAKAAQPEKTP